MASRYDSQPDDLGVEALDDPDDQGLSLDELSQAYAALLAKGADPYPQAPAADEPASEPADGGSPTLEVTGGKGDEAACEVTPRSILEAILFVGHPTGEPVTSERIAGLMRGVRPS